MKFNYLFNLLENFLLKKIDSYFIAESQLKVIGNKKKFTLNLLNLFYSESRLLIKKHCKLILP